MTEEPSSTARVETVVKADPTLDALDCKCINRLAHIPGEGNTADILTKLYDSPTHFEYLAGKLRSWDAAT